MTSYVFIRNNAVVEVRTYDPPLDLAEVKHRGGLPILRPILSVIDPPFDPLIQVREGPTYTLNARDAVEVFTIRPMTPAELDAVAARQAAEQLRKDRVTDAPDTVIAVPALRDKVNEIAAFLREQFGIVIQAP